MKPAAIISEKFVWSIEQATKLISTRFHRWLGTGRCVRPLGGHARQFRKRGVERRLVQVAILKLAGEIIGVGLHVEVAVAGQIEQDRARRALLLALKRFIDCGAYRVIGFRRWHDAFAAGEHDAGLEAQFLR